MLSHANSFIFSCLLLRRDQIIKEGQFYRHLLFARWELPLKDPTANSLTLSLFIIAWTAYKSSLHKYFNGKCPLQYWGNLIFTGPWCEGSSNDRCLIQVTGWLPVVWTTTWGLFLHPLGLLCILRNFSSNRLLDRAGRPTHFSACSNLTFHGWYYRGLCSKSDCNIGMIEGVIAGSALGVWIFIHHLQHPSETAVW